MPDERGVQSFRARNLNKNDGGRITFESQISQFANGDCLHVRFMGHSLVTIHTRKNQTIGFMKFTYISEKIGFILIQL